ncbi:hypothetical protein GALL_257400 [mine drainage metagenome]|uniref:Uncharacterized protein n=1 Tax=mine drainage metagenome TaxID=410659 RepID=A0A1J5RAH8_9ZZZZ
MEEALRSQSPWNARFYRASQGKWEELPDTLESF